MSRTHALQPRLQIPFKHLSTIHMRGGQQDDGALSEQSSRWSQQSADQHCHVISERIAHSLACATHVPPAAAAAPPASCSTASGTSTISPSSDIIQMSLCGCTPTKTSGAARPVVTLLAKMPAEAASLVQSRPYRFIPYSFPRWRIPDRQKNKHFFGGGETIGNAKTASKRSGQSGNALGGYIRGMIFQKKFQKISKKHTKKIQKSPPPALADSWWWIRLCARYLDQNYHYLQIMKHVQSAAERRHGAAPKYCRVCIMTLAFSSKLEYFLCWKKCGYIRAQSLKNYFWLRYRWYRPVFSSEIEAVTVLVGKRSWVCSFWPDYY